MTLTRHAVRGLVWRALADVRAFGDPGPVLIPAGWHWQVNTLDGPYRSISDTFDQAIRACTATVRHCRIDWTDPPF